MYKRLNDYKNIDQITVSIDGGDEKDNDEIRGKGVFARVIYNLKSCERIDSHIHINVACVITEGNLDNIAGLLNLDIKYRCLMISVLFNEGQAKKNYNLCIDERKFYQKICELIIGLRKKKIKVQLDLRPIAYWWLVILLKEEIENVAINEDCANTKIFYSATNKMYICNPSSFLGDKYEIKDRIPAVNKVRCTRDCLFNEQCLLCSINCGVDQFNICEYVIKEVNLLFQTILYSEIDKCKEYSITSYDGKLYYINYSTGIKYLLCNAVTEDVYSVKSVYDACSGMDKKKYKFMMAALLASDQIRIK